MANVEGIITEDIRSTIAVGLTAYDNQGKKVGKVDGVDRRTGYAIIQSNPFSDRDLYVPFSLITNIDPHDLFLSRSKDELKNTYAKPPARSTLVEDFDGKETATTTEASGYDGTPLIVEQAKIDHLKKHIETGGHVYSSDMADIGKIKRYDPATGWMMVEKGVMSSKRDLLIPVTLVEQVDEYSHDVSLVYSQADLQRMQHLEPADVVFVEAEFAG